VADPTKERPEGLLQVEVGGVWRSPDRSLLSIG